MINQSTIKSDLKKVALEQDQECMKPVFAKIEHNPEFCLAIQTYHVAALELLIESIHVESITTDDHFDETIARLRLGVSRCIMLAMDDNIFKTDKERK